MNILFWMLILLVMFLLWWYLSKFFTAIGERFLIEKDRMEAILYDEMIEKEKE